MQKRVYVWFIVTVFISIVLGACGSKNPPAPAQQPVVIPQDTKVGMEVEVPEWFSEPPQNPNYLYAAATRTAKDLGMATKFATQDARTEIGRQIETRVTGMMKSFQEQVGIGEEAEFLSQMTDVSKSVVAESVQGSKAIKQKTYREPAEYRSYVLVELPIGAANAALVEKIKNNQNMYTRFRASQAFQELEEEVEKYEEFKKEQQGGGAPQ